MFQFTNILNYETHSSVILNKAKYSQLCEMMGWGKLDGIRCSASNKVVCA